MNWWIDPLKRAMWNKTSTDLSNNSKSWANTSYKVHYIHVTWLKKTIHGHFIQPLSHSPGSPVKPTQFPSQTFRKTQPKPSTGCVYIQGKRMGISEPWKGGLHPLGRACPGRQLTLSRLTTNHLEKSTEVMNIAIHKKTCFMFHPKQVEDSPTVHFSVEFWKLIPITNSYIAKLKCLPHLLGHLWHLFHIP